MVILILALLLGAGSLALLAGLRGTSGTGPARGLDDARAEAQRWYERLGGQLMTLQSDEPAARQALADAAERYHAAGGQLDRAETVVQFGLARESALEGLSYVRTARTAMGLDPGPEIYHPAPQAGPGTPEERPLWRTALGAGAGALGGMVIFDALFGHHHGPGPGPGGF